MTVIMITFNLKAFGRNDSSDITGGSLAHIEVLLEPKEASCRPPTEPVTLLGLLSVRLKQQPSD